MIFVDFTKSFDTVNREAFWNILQKLGNPDYFIRFIFNLHTGMKASINLREFSKLVEVGNRRKHGCVLAPSLDYSFYSLVLCLY